MEMLYRGFYHKRDIGEDAHVITETGSSRLRNNNDTGCSDGNREEREAEGTIPSLVGTTVFLLEFPYIMHVRKQEKKAEWKIDRSINVSIIGVGRETIYNELPLSIDTKTSPNEITKVVVDVGV